MTLNMKKYIKDETIALQQKLTEKKINSERSCQRPNMLLVEAISLNDYNMAKKALSEGANPNFTYTYMSALIFCAYRNADKAAKALIEENANINLKVNGITPLIASVYLPGRDFIEIVKLLVENNANINETDIGKMTALMHSVRNKANRCAKFLLETPGILVDAKDIEDRDVFKHALDVLNEEMINFFSTRYPQKIACAKLIKEL